MYQPSSMKKSILFFTHHIQPSANPGGYRIGQYFPFIEKRGLRVAHLTSRANTATLVRAFRAADVVYVQRLLPGPARQLLLRKFARKIVYDFDDAIMFGSKGENPVRRRRFRGMVRMASAVLCGNAFLRSEAAQYKSQNVFVVPTVVDTADYPVKTHSPLSGSFIVGWMGSASTLKYFLDLLPLFRSSPPPTCFKVVADKRPEPAEPSVFFEQWSGEREKELLLAFDVGIMPVRNDLWSLGKCGLKLIQYASAGLPSVSHPIGVSTEIIEEGESGFLRKDVEGWKEALERLRLDTTLRARMGKRARAIAEEKYSLRVWGPRVADLVSDL
jgi:glycosyltransferase involved in cell wall biosynthesis